MHENELDIRAERQERERNRLLARLSPCNHLDLGRKVRLIEQAADEVELINGRCNDDHVNGM